MDSSVIAALISAIASITSALGAVLLGHHLRQREERAAAAEGEHAPSRESRQPQRQPGPVIRPAVVVGLLFAAAVFGVAAQALDEYERGHHGEPIMGVLFTLGYVVIGLFIAFLSWHAFRAGRKRTGLELGGALLEGAGVWTAWAAGYMVARGNVWSDVIALAITLGLGTVALQLVVGAVGALLAGLRRS